MTEEKHPEDPLKVLAPVVRILSVTTTEASTAWLRQGLASVSSSAVRIETATIEAAMTLLRDELFDAVVVHHAGELDAIRALGPLRAASPDTIAVIVVGQEPASVMATKCMQASAEVYVDRASTDANTLLWTLARAIERQRLLRLSKTLQLAVDHQRVQQHQEVLHQLRSQRCLLLEHSGRPEESDPSPPEWLVDYFQDLLRIFVVSGSTMLHDEVAQLVDRLQCCEVTIAEALLAHTMAVERLILGLGNRPVWHILGRANILAYEVMMQMQPRVAA